VLGTTPLTVELPVGSLSMIITQHGFVEQSRTAEIRDGATTRLDVAMERAAATVAVLSVRGTPAGAVARLAGREIGRVPFSLGSLDPGTARLEVSYPGREPVALQIPLEPGGATRVDVALHRREERAWDTVRWVGYAVGGASLVGFAVVGGTAASAHSTFFSQPTRAEFDSVGALNTTADVLLITGVVLAATTLVLDLVLPYPPRSRARVSIHR
jgi:hypothetical protein